MDSSPPADAGPHVSDMDDLRKALAVIANSNLLIADSAADMLTLIDSLTVLSESDLPIADTAADMLALMDSPEGAE